MKAISLGWQMASIAACFSFAAVAAHAGWHEGDCNDHVGSGACVEYNDAATGGKWWHITDSHSGSGWHGYFSTVQPYSGSTPDDNNEVIAPMTDFRFCGQTTLSCSVIPDLNCNLCLDGEVSVVGNTAKVRINGGTVTGPGQCANVSMSGFPWYVDDDHDYSPTGGIPIASSSSSYSGNVGNTIFSVGSLSVNGDVHNVEFHNNDPARSFFRLANSPVYTFILGQHVQVCTLTGDMEIQGPPSDINIRYRP